MAGKHDAGPETKGTLGADALEHELTTDLDGNTLDRPKGMPLHTRIFIGLAAGVAAGLTLGRQLMVVYLAILGGIGTAGVPARDRFRSSAQRWLPSMSIHS